MEKITIIESEGGESAGGKQPLPPLRVTQKHGLNNVDWVVTDAAENYLATVALDYFDGELRLFVWLPEDNEPSHKIHISNLRRTKKKDIGFNLSRLLFGDK